MTKVAICIPSGGTWRHEFGLSLVGIIGSTRGVQLSVLSKASSVNALVRTSLAEDALSQGADWLAWFDADQTFPPDTLARLLSLKRPLVAANYARRDYWPIRPVGPALPSGPDLQPAEGCGLGCTLAHRSVFERTPRPWFAPHWDDAGEYVGVDIAFFRKAYAAGFPLYIDPQLSREVGHIGCAEYALAEKPPAAGLPVLHP
jgi:hypothetical protein